jgi:hypothetical protein
MTIQKAAKIAFGSVTLVFGGVAFVIIGAIFLLCVLVYLFAISTSCLLEHIFKSFVILNESPSEQPQLVGRTHGISIQTAEVFNLSQIRDKLRAA